MENSIQVALAKDLAKLGLHETLIAARTATGGYVNKIKEINGGITFDRVGSFIASDVPVIGRVGIPDPKLEVPWGKSMPFYGKWFDGVGKNDPSYTIRRNIISTPHARLLEQIQRDDEYALIGSYYSVFQRIMDIKRRVPLVVFDDSLLSTFSFPVILPDIEDKIFQKNLEVMLRVLLKPNGSEDEAAEDDGIEVNEVSAEDIEKYFPPEET